MSRTNRQLERGMYRSLCRIYNRLEAELPDKQSQSDFVLASVSLHAAKGWDYIPKSWGTAAFIKQQGTRG